MRTFRIWDKQEKINNVNAEYVLDSIKASDDDEIFLVVDEYGIISQIEIVSIIKSIHKLDSNLTAEQTAQAYLDIRVQEEEKAKQDAITLEQQANKISILESENADLLLDSANKDIQMKTLEKDLADLTLIVGGI